MVGVLMVIHYLTCFSMILVILLQSGKGGGLAGAFGGGGSTIFGGRGAGTVLTRATMVLGAMFFVTSLTLALMSAAGGVSGTTSRSLIQEEAKKAQQTQPVSGPAQNGSKALPPAGTPSPTQTAPQTAPSKPVPAPAPATTK